MGRGFSKVLKPKKAAGFQMTHTLESNAAKPCDAARRKPSGNSHH
jgi:hypothetical protein